MRQYPLFEYNRTIRDDDAPTESEARKGIRNTAYAIYETRVFIQSAGYLYSVTNAHGPWVMVLCSLPRPRTVTISSPNVIELFFSAHFLSIWCAQCTKNDGSVCRIPQHIKIENESPLMRVATPGIVLTFWKERSSTSHEDPRFWKKILRGRELIYFKKQNER
jgi:hypothetical protein